MRTFNILGIRTEAQTFQAAVATLVSWAAEARPRYVSTATAYTLVMGSQHPSIFAALNAADMVTADGMPLVWLQRWSGIPGAERVYGPDLMHALCRESEQRGIRHYFYGGLPGVAHTLSVVLQERYPKLIVAGAHSPAGDVLGEAPQQATVDMLNAAQADIIWIGLGSPKQDLWMHLYRNRLDAPLLIGVGAAFDFLSGVKPQAPRWMQRGGLEWFYRLIQEPQRLWKRYLIYNLWFVALLLSARLPPNPWKRRA